MPNHTGAAFAGGDGAWQGGEAFEGVGMCGTEFESSKLAARGAGAEGGLLGLNLRRLVGAATIALAATAFGAVLVHPRPAEAQMRNDGASGLRRGEGAPPAQAAPQRVPVRSETTPFGNWTMTCQEEIPTPGAKGGKKACWGSMKVSDSKSQHVVLVWLIGKDGQGAPTIALQTPTGVMVSDGVDLSFGGNARKLTYRWCDQTGCEASAPFDAAFARSFAGQKEASVAFHLRDGRQVSVQVSVAGADKLVPALLR